jgi:hypothetical protein
MELNNILHRQIIPRQPVTSFRSTSTDGEQNITGWARCEYNRTKYMTIVRTHPPLWLDLNAEIFSCFHTRKRIEESLLQPINVAIVYIMFTGDTKMHKTMLEPTVVMYGWQTWSVTDRITLCKFFEEEHFEESVWASKWVRGLENRNQRRTEGIILNLNPCGGGVEYLHREPASRKRQRNGTKNGRAIA